MEVTYLYICNASNPVVKNKQETEEHGCVLIFDNKHLSELVFICLSCLKNIREHLPENYCFQEMKKCLIETFFKKRSRASVSRCILSVNLLGDKIKYVKGTITIAHSKGHDCIILFFDFKGFLKTVFIDS